MVLVSRNSDRTVERKYHAAIPFSSIFFLCVASSGIYSAPPEKGAR
jgi:hypothetical protein